MDLDYFELLNTIENGTPEEQNEAELEIMGRWYYRDD
jgi:hypothetical protein